MFAVANETTLPKEVPQRFNENFETEVYGDFLVCPLTRTRSGYMQTVCLKSAKPMVVSGGVGEAEHAGIRAG